jgi:hypothetical protein
MVIQPIEDKHDSSSLNVHIITHILNKEMQGFFYWKLCWDGAFFKHNNQLCVPFTFSTQNDVTLPVPPCNTSWQGQRSFHWQRNLQHFLKATMTENFSGCSEKFCVSPSKHHNTSSLPQNGLRQKGQLGLSEYDIMSTSKFC